MMNFAETDEELAVVLGHEYAHNLMKHSAAKYKNASIGNILGTIIDGVAASQGINTGGLGQNLGTNIAVASYSIGFEKEADYVGLYVTKLAGFEIKDAPNFWRKMSIRNPEAIYNATTHPSNPERFISLEKTVKEIEGKLAEGKKLFPELKAEEKPKS